MKYKIYQDVQAEKLSKLAPPAYQDTFAMMHLSEKEYSLIVFGTSGEVIRSSFVKKALDELSNNGQKLIAVGHNFTQESRDLLKGHSALIVCKDEFPWTDSSFDHINLIIAAKVKGPAHESYRDRNQRNNTMLLEGNASVKEFAELARQYCELIETHQELEVKDFLEISRQLLVQLYINALALPILEWEAAIEEENTETGKHQSLSDSLQRYMANWDYYYEVIDPYQQEEPCSTLLSDDLMDIFKDLESGLSRYGDGVGLTEAVWLWKFSFTNHWGEHLTSALRPLHRLLEGMI